MALHRPTKRTAGAVLTALALLAAPTVLGPATASAQAPGSAVPAVPGMPAVPGLPGLPLDGLGRPTPEVLDRIDGFADQPQVPEQVREALKEVTGFFRGDGEPGVQVPENGPGFTQFGWPTVAMNCIGGTSNAVGLAMAVPGPAQLPLPGVPAGHASFVFTGLGTGTVAPQQRTAMRVHWVNVANGRMGTTDLGFHGINPDGPATVNGTADTGPGTVVALLEGGVTTQEENGPADCTFLPTAGVITVR